MKIGNKPGHYEITDCLGEGGTGEVYQARVGELLTRAEAEGGLDTRGLRTGDTLDIQTCYSRYTLRLADPSTGDGIAISDGQFITGESAVRLLGSTLSGRGTLVKLGWVFLSYKLMLRVPDGELMTSRVRGVMINGMPLVPATGTH